MFQVYLNKKVFLLIQHNKNTDGENLSGGQSEYFNPLECLFKSIGSIQIKKKIKKKVFQKGGKHLSEFFFKCSFLSTSIFSSVPWIY